MIKKLTHADLVKYGANWLHKTNKHPVVITEIAGTGEEPDVLGFDYGCTTLLEAKASRSDFLSDKKKWFRKEPERGMGTLRYYICPTNMIKPEELPQHWGLLYIKHGGKRVKMIVRATAQEKSHNYEQHILMSVIRRTGKHIPEGGGTSINCYHYETGNTACLYTIGVKNNDK